MFILASSSKSRLEVLKKLNLEPSLIFHPEIDETPLKKETPRELSFRLAKLKGTRGLLEHPERTILSADTVVAAGRRVIEKTANKEEVVKAMELLSGRSHSVYTTVCVTSPSRQKAVTVETRVKFKRLSAGEIAQYAESGEGLGKAGGYTITGFAESFIIKMTGSYSGVIGLPSYETVKLFKLFNLC